MSACDLLKMSALESKVMQIERENTILKQKLSECLVMIGVTRKGDADMNINGKWYTETEVQAYVSKLESENEEVRKVLGESIETLQKENETLKSKLNGSNELLKTPIEELKIEKLKQYWRFKFDNAKNYYDEHWEATERREHREYVEALNDTLKALDEIEDLKKYLKLAVDDLSSEAGMNFEYEDEVDRLIGGTE